MKDYLVALWCKDWYMYVGPTHDRHKKHSIDIWNTVYVNQVQESVTYGIRSLFLTDVQTDDPAASVSSIRLN